MYVYKKFWSSMYEVFIYIPLVYSIKRGSKVEYKNFFKTPLSNLIIFNPWFDFGRRMLKGLLKG